MTIGSQAPRSLRPRVEPACETVDRGELGSRPRCARTDGSAPNLVVFPSTHECGRCPMRVRESRAKSRTTRSTLICEIPIAESARGRGAVDRSRAWLLVSPVLLFLAG